MDAREMTRALNRRDFLRLTGFGLAGAGVLGIAGCGGGSGSGEEFPSDTIEMIIAYDAGGSTDVSIRELAQLGEETCGTNIIASNQTGSAGAVGFTATANAEPDGYTVGGTATELAYLQELGTSEVGPDDLRGVMRYALNPHVFFVPTDSPYENLQDLLEAAEGGETINVATSGTGSVYHLAFAGMALEAGLLDQFTNIPFDGGAPAVQAAISGQADMVVVVYNEARSQVDADRLRPIAVADEERLDVIPDTPTLQEEGIDWTSASHLGLAVPAETPDDRVQTLNECLREALETDEFQEAMREQELNIAYLGPEEFDEYLREIADKYTRVVQEAGITAG